MNGFRAISGALTEWNGTFLSFIKQLDADGVDYLSYSKVSSVESCEYRFFLQYVERVKVREPWYFKKGNVFHRAASMAHRQLRLLLHFAMLLLLMGCSPGVVKKAGAGQLIFPPHRPLTAASRLACLPRERRFGPRAGRACSHSTLPTVA